MTDDEDNAANVCTTILIMWANAGNNKLMSFRAKGREQEIMQLRYAHVLKLMFMLQAESVQIISVEVGGHFGRVSVAVTTEACTA